jgi:hypothetical protein
MMQEKRKKRKKELRFNETGIKLALSVLDKLEKPLELLFYLMRNENEKSFVVMLLSAKNVELDTMINIEKRDTDILFEMDKDQSLYALICQETKIDGGYRFAERMHQSLAKQNAKEIYSVEIEVGSSKYTIKEVTFKLIETYLKAVNDEKEGEIIFHSMQ